MDLTILRALAKRYSTAAAAIAELSNLRSILTLPKLTVHVISDVHGEDVKLRQVVNNASGSLRPLLSRVFASSPAAAPSDDAAAARAGAVTPQHLDQREPSARGGDPDGSAGGAGARSPREIDQLLALIYYPRETWLAMVAGKPEAERRALLLWLVPLAGQILRDLARHTTLKHVDQLIPDPFDPIFRELLFAGELSRQPAYLEQLVEPFLRQERDVDLVRMFARVIRNLAVGELVVAGDLGDRGPRIDRVIDVLMQQPNVTITWGNHDASWMAACLGHPAAIATVIRLSLRYQRLAQLEDGYGISLEPLQRLVSEAYGDDPAESFLIKGEPLRPPLLLARMQKAIAILQHKLEGQLFLRRPEWGLEDRAVLRAVDAASGTITLAGQRYPLHDLRWPTVDWADPLRLSDGEQRCLDELTRSFTGSTRLWVQMSYLARHGQMMVRRDRCAIFHGCVPVDEDGGFLAFSIDGELRRGRALFTAFEAVVQRAFRKRSPEDLDLLFYLWTGPLSPCFGKDKMATFESYFVADPATHAERKNPYFELLHDAGFCARVLRELGVDETSGVIVNGHVPVRVEQGETPIKRSGRAITIDGAFAAAYGDKGFSLVLDARRMYLAQHHHFESAEAAVERHADIVPTVSDVEVYAQPRTVGDTEKGEELRAEIALLEQLVAAFERNLIREA
jgi:fructose-1,6-bisphosphatase III